MGDIATTTTMLAAKPAPTMSVYAVHCHMCGGVFVISNTCTSCSHVQCQKCL